MHYSTLEEQNKIRVVFAHFQTSTKPHDMIYALKNTFPYMFEDIEVGYSTDIKTVFNDFYRHVATEDISILCFGSNDLLDGRTGMKSSIESYKLCTFMDWCFGSTCTFPYQCYNSPAVESLYQLHYVDAHNN